MQVLTREKCARVRTATVNHVGVFNYLVADCLTIAGEVH
jgi:hypothetical protein